jgi:hypothetical protein
MKMLKAAVIALAVVVFTGLTLKGAGLVSGGAGKSPCAGFKPETCTLCWKSLV